MVDTALHRLLDQIICIMAMQDCQGCQLCSGLPSFRRARPDHPLDQPTHFPESLWQLRREEPEEVGRRKHRSVRTLHTGHQSETALSIMSANRSNHSSDTGNYSYVLLT